MVRKTIRYEDGLGEYSVQELKAIAESRCILHIEEDNINSYLRIIHPPLGTQSYPIFILNFNKKLEETNRRLVCIITMPKQKEQLSPEQKKKIYTTIQKMAEIKVQKIIISMI